MKSRTLAASTAIAAAVTLAPVTSTHANADAIDDTLAKLPQGPISCAQAEKYWTNEADYQNKVRQAQTIARFDSRGPQILEALGRVMDVLIAMERARPERARDPERGVERGGERRAFFDILTHLA